jgi:hypothetical protein
MVMGCQAERWIYCPVTLEGILENSCAMRMDGLDTKVGIKKEVRTKIMD